MKLGYIIQGKSLLDELPFFRGTHCESPYFCPKFSEEDEINRLSKGYWEQLVTDGGLTQDLDLAKRIIQLYEELAGSKYHLVEVSREKKLKTQKGFLGYDVSNKVLDFSLLVSLNLKSWEHKGEKKIWNSNPLYKLIGIFFFEKLNNYGLFDDFETATFFLECENELDKIHGVNKEHGLFEVVGLVEV